MPIIEGLGDDVPFIQPTVSAGFYTAVVVSATYKPSPANDPAKAPQIESEFKIVGGANGEDVPDKGRTIRDWTSTKMKTRLKRLFTSAGIDLSTGNADVALLKDKVVKIHVVQEPYVDKAGIAQMSAKVREFMIPVELENQARAAVGLPPLATN